MNEDWKTKRYRYQITLKSGKIITTGYFDTYQDLENFIRTGFAGFYTPEGFIETPIADIQAVQPIEEGQAMGNQPPVPPADVAADQPPTPPAGPGSNDQVPQPPQQAGSVISPNQSVDVQKQPTEGELPL